MLLLNVDKYPDINFVIKEHPSYRRSVIGKVTPHANIHFANGHPTPELIANADAVVTLNSTVGIEALVLEKKVITLGLAAYNIEGLVLHSIDPDMFEKSLTAIRDW